MADKNIVIRKRNQNNDAWENLYPVTSADNVIASNGESLENHQVNQEIHFKKTDISKADVGLGNVDNVKQAPETRTITAGNGLTGGGSLAANRTITLGTPTTLFATSTNSVSAGGHSHALSIATKEEAEAGTNTTKFMTPQRTKEAIEEMVSSGYPRQYFYQNGNEFTGFTGGWVKGYSLGTHTFTKNADHIFLKVNSASMQKFEVAVVSNNMIDLSNFKRLAVKIYGQNFAMPGHNHVDLIASTVKNGAMEEFDAKAGDVYVRENAWNILKLDVSSLSGSYYVRVHNHDNVYIQGRGKEILVYEVWGEY